MWNLKSELLFYDSKQKLKDYIDMLCIIEISKGKTETDKTINKTLIESYLKSKGYTANFILRKPVMVKAFTCVYIHDNCVEVWHDIPNSKSQFINNSLLTGLPITLNYMEKL
jgi:hypothetical protein